MRAKLIYEEIGFERNVDPKRSMGIGKKAQLIKELEKIGLSEYDIFISPTFTIVPSGTHSSDTDRIFQIASRYMDEAKTDLVLSLSDKNDDSTAAIKAAIKDGVDIGDIELLIKWYSADKKVRDHATISLAKYKRTSEEAESEDEDNIYIFMGYTDKVPVEINGKTYYEDKFAAESMLKIDKYNPNDLKNVSSLKMRAIAQNRPNSGVYMIRLPKEVMDEDRYDGIPDEWNNLIDEHKIKL